MYFIFQKLERLKKIEKEVIMIRDMFLQLSTIVNEQQELLDYVDIGIDSVRQEVEKANDELKIAEEYQHTFRKNKLYILGIVVTLIATTTGLLIRK